MNLIPYLAAHQKWSSRVFGPGPRPNGLSKHIRKELAEIKKKPNDIKEWVDIVILGLDGAMRAGHSPKAVAQALVDKQRENMGRQWPVAHPDKPCEHIRTKQPKTRKSKCS